MVACKDFTDGGKRLLEFAHLKNTCINREQNGYGKEPSSILQAIDEQTLLPPDQLRDFFWDMFIADALLANFDRYNENWGILVNEQSKLVKIAPVYDCGSCLYPLSMAIYRRRTERGKVVWRCATRIEKGKEACLHWLTIKEQWIQGILVEIICGKKEYNEKMIRQEVEVIRVFSECIEIVRKSGVAISLKII
ncbi:MAG: hypothetical protein ACK5H4_13600 [Lacrimispora sphenoides]